MTIRQLSNLVLSAITKQEMEKTESILMSEIEKTSSTRRISEIQSLIEVLAMRFLVLEEG